MIKNIIYKRLFLIIIIILIIIPNIYSSVADLYFTIQDNGLAKISGYTDYPNVTLPNSTYSYTSKQGNNWSFDINYPVFEKFYYSISLPIGYKLDSVVTKNNYKVSSTNNKITIIGYGKDNSLNIKLKYSKDINYSKTSNFWIYFLSIILIILISVYSFLFLKPKKKNKIDLDYKNLTERQKKILKIIYKEKEVSQNKLVKILKLPKSSVSRNVSSLVSKGYIVKKRNGLTYLLKIKDI